MSDPLDVLRLPSPAAEPDPGFAAELRARLERALALPTGVAVSTATLDLAPAVPVPAPAAITPYLAVADAAAALAWYADVLDAEQDGEPILMPDGRVGHAELVVFGARLMLADEFPDLGLVAPRPGAVHTSLVLTVPDVDATTRAAVAAGAVLQREIYEAHGNRNATVVDPFGHRWMLQTPVAAADTGYPAGRPLRQGDVGYASLWTADATKARTFYGAVLGWDLEHATDQGGLVAGSTPQHGLYAQDGQPFFLAYAVDDVAAAVERVRAAGGQAQEPVRQPYGLDAECVDPEGRRFAVYEPAGDDPGRTSPPGAGDLSYITMGVRDTAVMREFFGAVLGWEFAPGHVDDGWEVRGSWPMTGMHRDENPAIVPMYTVGDLAAAIAAVRAGGGVSSDPQQVPYGAMAECTDDQGARFYLHQL